MPESPYFRPEILVPIRGPGSRSVAGDPGTSSELAPGTSGEAQATGPTVMTGRVLRALLDDLEKTHAESGAFDREIVLRVEVDDEFYVGGLRDVSVDDGCAEDPAIVFDGDEGVIVDSEIGPTDERSVELSRAARSLLAELLQEDVDGGELLKEAWEICESDADRQILRGELIAIINWLRDEGPSS